MHTMKSPGDANGLQRRLIVVLQLEFKIKNSTGEQDLVNGAVGTE